MEDFHHAGGMATLLRELKPLLRLEALTVTGRTLGEEIEALGAGFAQDVVRPFSNPIYPQGGIAVLRGNLAPGGAIIKQSAANPKLMEHEGRAVVFENVEDLVNRIDRDDLDVTADDILVLKSIGPKGAPGMPEAGYVPIPKKLGRAGVKDMVRISDGRMSGTAAGTIVLHVTPESATGGPLAWVQSGDRIRLDVPARELELLVSDEEMARRRKAKPVKEPRAGRGYHQALPADRDAGRPGRGLRFPAQIKEDDASRAGEPHQALRGRALGRRHQPLGRAGRVRLPPRAVGLRQDDDAAHDRGLHRARRRRDPRGRQGDLVAARRGAARAAQHEHDLPELRGLAAHDGAPERGLRPQDEEVAAGRTRGAHRRAARGDQAIASGRSAIRRSSPAGSSSAWRSPGRSRPTRYPAARRAALEPRRQPARGHALRDPPPARRVPQHLDLRDPRPDGSDDHGRSHRRDERRAHRADRHARGRLRPPQLALRRALHRREQRDRRAPRFRQPGRGRGPHGSPSARANSPARERT